VNIRDKKNRDTKTKLSYFKSVKKIDNMSKISSKSLNNDDFNLNSPADTLPEESIKQNFS
jgi:hypothetical protein